MPSQVLGKHSKLVETWFSTRTAAFPVSQSAKVWILASLSGQLACSWIVTQALMPLLSEVRRDVISVTASTFPPTQVWCFEVHRLLRSVKAQYICEHHGKGADRTAKFGGRARVGTQACVKERTC